MTSNSTAMSESRPAIPLRLHYPLYPIRATYILLGLNILVFIPTLLMENTVYGWGGLIPLGVLQYGQWWRLLTAGFIHGGIMHLAFNMYALYILGREVERIFGPWRFLTIYTLALLGGNLLVTLFSQLASLTVGASGAILGLLGALVAYFWRNREQLVGAKKRLINLLNTAAINLIIGLMPQVSLWGHLGGTLAGLLAGLVIIPRYKLVRAPHPHFEFEPATSRDLAGVFLLAAGCALLLALTCWLRG